MTLEEFCRDFLTDDSIYGVLFESIEEYPGFEIKVKFNDGSSGYWRYKSSIGGWTCQENTTTHCLPDRY